MRLKSYQPVRFHRALRVNLSVMSMALDSTLDLTSCSIFLMYRGLAPSEDVWSVDICKKKTVDKNLSKRIILIWSRIIDQLCFKQMIDLSLSLSLFQSSPPPKLQLLSRKNPVAEYNEMQLWYIFLSIWQIIIVTSHICTIFVIILTLAAKIEHIATDILFMDGSLNWQRHSITSLAHRYLSKVWKIGLTNVESFWREKFDKENH